MSKLNEVQISMLNRMDSVISSDYENDGGDCCNDGEQVDELNRKSSAGGESVTLTLQNDDSDPSVVEKPMEDTTDGRIVRKRGNACGDNNNWAEHKNVAEGLMDIALLSANANQLRFLITYNHKASTYFISLGLIVLSLLLQVAVGIALIFKRRMKRSRTTKRTHTRINECLIGGVFMVTVVNILLAAFTTTDGDH